VVDIDGTQKCAQMERETSPLWCSTLVPISVPPVTPSLSPLLRCCVVLEVVQSG
jgi:hypothetical protein